MKNFCKPKDTVSGSKQQSIDWENLLTLLQTMCVLLCLYYFSQDDIFLVPSICMFYCHSDIYIYFFGASSVVLLHLIGLMDISFFHTLCFILFIFFSVSDSEDNPRASFIGKLSASVLFIAYFCLTCNGISTGPKAKISHLERDHIHEKLYRII